MPIPGAERSKKWVYGSARLLGWCVRTQLEAWMSSHLLVLCVVICICVRLITRPEEPYRMWGVVSVIVNTRQ
jgi:hypothetical protein